MKHIIAAAVIALSSLIAGCGDFSCSDIMTNRARRLSGVESIEEIQSKIAREADMVKHRGKDPRTLAILYQRLGEKHLQQKKWDSAIEALGESMRYGRKNMLVYYSMGAAYANKSTESGSDPALAAQAEQFYMKALELNPGYNDAAYALGILQFYTRKDREVGLKTMFELSTQHPSYYRGRFALGRFYYEMGRSEQSLATFEGLYRDLENAPQSDMVREYKRLAGDNIARIISERRSGSAK